VWPVPASAAIDAYLTSLPEAQRQALEDLRRVIAAAAPEAEEAMSYGAPAFRYRNRPLAGFAAAKAHLSYLPMSPAVIEQLADRLAGWPTTKGTIHFTPEHPLPPELVAALVAARKAELDGGRPG
jgi:uncharacterized protein YdhG (YjbR/CyaY superfamily)